MSIGVRSTNPYGEALEQSFNKVYRVGDENKPARIREATRSGYEAAMNLQ